MKIDLWPVSLNEKETLRNLLEKYDYEFSQWDERDVDENGLYGYQYLDCYWTEPNRWAYFIRADGKLAGFVMVNDYPETGRRTDFCMAEFFVMHKYRRHGVGRAAAIHVFGLHHGTWQLKRHPHNTASVHFWNRIVTEYTNGHYELMQAYPDPKVGYDDGTPADVFFFDNTTF